MKKNLCASLGLLASLAVLQGCAIGYNSTLFVTKSNIGIDADTKPPTLDISVARREGVIAPGFEAGQTPPVMASFGTSANPFSRFFFGVESTFAGGEAAVELAPGPGGTVTPNDAELCLSTPPEKKKILGIWDVSVPEKGAVRPFFFGTDTILGFKASWTGTAGQFPDSLKLGFNRKEIAWAPVFGTDEADCMVPGTQEAGSYAISMPAFLGVLDNDLKTGQMSETGYTWLQYFATGDAATALARQDEVRHVMMKRMLPGVHQGTYDAEDPQVKCIQAWLTAGGDAEKRQQRVTELQTWWNEEKKLDGFASILIKTAEHEQQRDEYIAKKNIDCND